ncbi:hypothetical protein [Rhizobium sp. BK176]|uniref:hypothetical protein n=1 Tax=Rhizobium sp. BK176 TaxID=2587071 RepID=UPI002167CD4F|nr:hypothetical protein [Rhizobium sp. BK176]MCS4088834.1 hypothetical protein [Rhizobium sp. BK176]
MNYQQFLKEIERDHPIQLAKAEERKREADALYDEISPHLDTVGFGSRPGRCRVGMSDIPEDQA